MVSSVAWAPCSESAVETRTFDGAMPTEYGPNLYWPTLSLGVETLTTSVSDSNPGAETTTMSVPGESPFRSSRWNSVAFSRIGSPAADPTDGRACVTVRVGAASGDWTKMAGEPGIVLGRAPIVNVGVTDSFIAPICPILLSAWWPGAPAWIDVVPPLTGSPAVSRAVRK